MTRQNITVMQKVRNKAREVVYSYDDDNIEDFYTDINETFGSSFVVKDFFGFTDKDVYNNYDVITAWKGFVNEFLDERFPQLNDPLAKAEKYIKLRIQGLHYCDNDVADFNKDIEKCFEKLIEAIRETLEGKG